MLMKKITALIPEDLIDDVQTLSHGKNITESLIIVMREWVSAKRLRELNQEILKAPLKFQDGYGGSEVRALNRRDK